MKKKPKVRKPPTGSKRTPSSKASTSSTDNHSKWIRIERPFPLPVYVRGALQTLDDAGHVAYVVGGSVRDFLLGRESKDHDIATSAGPDELCALFPDAITVGKSFGVLKIPLKGKISGPGPEFLEIAAFRTDLAYRDHRHPTGVLLAGPIEDACRRDFTINALFFDPKTSRILDCTGGVEDLKARIVRAIGDPMERFNEDALRLLRAVRFTTSLGFTLEPSTAAAAKTRAKLIRTVSLERIRDELTLMWIGKNPHLALQLLSDLGLLTLVLPEVEALKGVGQPPLEGDLWCQNIRAMQALVRQNTSINPVLAWAMVLHEIGKPIAAKRSGGKNFNGHENDAASMALAIAERLKMTKAEGQTIAKLVEDQVKFKEVFQMREATLQRLIRQPHFELLLALHKAVAVSSDGNLMAWQFGASRLEELRKAHPESERKLITGEDLIQLGFRPGPLFSEILRTVEDLSFEKKLQTHEEALEYVIRHFAS